MRLINPIRNGVCFLLIGFLGGLAYPAEKTIEQWDIFEIELKGPAEGNPFVDVHLNGHFTPPISPRGAKVETSKTTHVVGFYDGDGVYRVRFMPDRPGQWKYTTTSNRAAMNTSGTFTVTPPSPGNHGPVRVRNTHHFAYADGTPYYPFGTTCYAWIHQTEALQEQTLATLKDSPFNKIRMCVFPKWYAYNAQEPPRYPLEGTPPNQWDFARFNPEFFRHLEKRIGQLRDLNIEADIILFHPYDEGHWGFDRMTAEANDRYLRYVVARLAAYRNVWWSLANEYDLMKEKKQSDWDRFFQIIAAADPYSHLRSIHNCRDIYNHTHPWVTHVSFQNGSAVEDVGRAQILRDLYRKPVVYDEVKYEGNLPQRWGNLSAEELVHRFWCGTIAGTYVGHGETYLHPEHIIWWATGGTLHGESPKRIAFLRKIVEEGRREGINPIDKWQDLRTAGKKDEYYLVYFGKETPTEWSFSLPTAREPNLPMKLRVEIIDTWEMTITPVEGVFELTQQDDYRYVCKNIPTIKLPGKPYMALRMTRVSGE